MTPDYLSKPDGNIVQLLTDSRIWSVAGGAIGLAFAEKQIIPMNRAAFGWAVEVDGSNIIVSDADYKAKKNIPNQQAAMNRTLMRLALIVAPVAVIEFTKKGSPMFIANLQYVMLGVAAVSLARILQDLFPVLVAPARK